MKNKLVYLALAASLLLTSCADKVSYTINESISPVGFWYGLWHGSIAGVAFIVSLFSSDTAIYAVYNNGGWYNFGFILGLGCLIKITTNSNRR